MRNERITFILPGTVANSANPQGFRNNTHAAVINAHGVVLGQSTDGYMHPITDGRLSAAIHLNWRGSGATATSFFVSIIPYADFVSGSSIVISLMGSAPQSLSQSTVEFTAPTTGSPVASAAVSAGVLSITTSSGIFKSGQLVSFFLPETVTNAASVQPALNNVSVAVIDNNVTRSVNRSVFFHAIHDSAATFSHSLSGYTTAAVGVKTAGTFLLPGAAVGNVLAFSYPEGLFAPSRLTQTIKKMTQSEYFLIYRGSRAFAASFFALLLVVCIVRF
jgi:hypothetical protein